MESKTAVLRNFSEFQKPDEFSLPSFTTDPSKIFSDRSDYYLNEKYLFFAKFNTIPNIINEIRINCRKAYSTPLC